jgi:hypothetical protein
VSSLDAIISPSQSAFVPTRSIAENMLLAQDYHENEGKACCTLEVDLMKAYDSIGWDFLLHCLSCFGSPDIFVGWIQEYATSPKFSMALNGTLGCFDGKKGSLVPFPFFACCGYGDFGLAFGRKC